MEHEAPKPDCILQIEAIGCCNACAKKVRKRILRLEGVYSVEMDRERRWVKIAGNVESVMDYFTRRSGKLKNAKVIFYCSKEAKTDVKYHGKKNQRDEYTHENTPMENQAENNLPKETQNPYNEYDCHQKNIPKNNCPMQNNSSDTRERNYYKREGENCNQDSSTHTTDDHYAPRKDWVHRVENYVPPPPKEDQYRSVRVDDRECKCEFHAWKRQGSSSSSGRFVFDHRVPRADMRSASARWFREKPPPFMPLPRPPLGPFAYR